MDLIFGLKAILFVAVTVTLIGSVRFCSRVLNFLRDETLQWIDRKFRN